MWPDRITHKLNDHRSKKKEQTIQTVKATHHRNVERGDDSKRTEKVTKRREGGTENEGRKRITKGSK